MEITQDHIGRVLRLQTGSQRSRRQVVRTALYLDVVVVAINPYDDHDISVRPVMPDTSGEWPARWVSASKLSEPEDCPSGTKVVIRLSEFQAAMLDAILADAADKYRSAQIPDLEHTTNQIHGEVRAALAEHAKTRMAVPGPGDPANNPEHDPEVGGTPKGRLA